MGIQSISAVLKVFKQCFLPLKDTVQVHHTNSKHSETQTTKLAKDKFKPWSIGNVYVENI